jgi:HSP20 family protein
MNVRDLIPWRRSSESEPVPIADPRENPFLSLHREMNRLFDDVFRGFDLRAGRLGGVDWPRLEIAETETAVVITAEVPGLESKDVEVLLDNNVLTIRGERQAQSTDTARRISERFYGVFERRIPLSVDIDDSKVTADCRNGVLTITLPKTPAAQERVRRIAVNG